MAVDWSYFNDFSDETSAWLPAIGEGDNMATQIVTAVSKLIYKWYNDGDVYDNTNGYLRGWANDLSSYANWLYTKVDAFCLQDVFDAKTDDDYEEILKELADTFLDRDYLLEMEEEPKLGSIYDCDGPFKFEEIEEEEEW